MPITLSQSTRTSRKMMHILILGAGYGGLRAALDMHRHMHAESENVQVTLIDQHDYHQHVCLLHLLATKVVPAPRVAIPFGQIVRSHHRLRIRHGRVSHLDLPQRRVILADGDSYPYDRLILALGAQTHYGTVEGAAEHTLPLRSFDEAIALRDHIIEQFRQAAHTTDPKARRILLTCAIVGGGFTGCQLAGELATWAPRLARDVGVSPSEVRVVLIECSDMLLSQFGAWATKETESALDRLRVSVYLNTTVERVESQCLFIDQQRLLRAATLIWAGGIEAPPLLTQSGLPTDSIGRVYVDRHLRVNGTDGVYGLGDCAHIPDDDGTPLAATASYAMRQGKYLAASLLSANHVEPYQPLRLGLIVSLGSDYAVGNPMGMPMVGMPALLLKWSIEQWYERTLE